MVGTGQENVAPHNFVNSYFVCVFTTPTFQMDDSIATIPAHARLADFFATQYAQKTRASD
jgi:hypothetical protein